MNPTTPTPDQIANVTQAITVAFWLGVALIAYAYLSHQTEDNGPTRWSRWRAWLTAHYLTSSSDRAPLDDADTEPIHVSIQRIDTSASIGGRAATDTDGGLPDTDAADGWTMPRLSRHISDGELIVILAALRAPSGKHRFSANQIAALVGGGHNATMARVKELRRDAPPVVYRALAPEQQQLRDQLQLDQR
jgi:hypothetical protein